MKASAIGLVFVFACSGGGGSSADDGAVEDATLTDAGLIDATLTDATLTDSGLPDAPMQNVDAGPLVNLEEGLITQIIGDPIRDVDILFVVDNSQSMRDEQIALANGFSRIADALNNIKGGFPNVHLGVVSSDMGAGPYNISGCQGTGDNGILQNAAVGSPGCQTPSDRYISDVADGAGGRLQNYQGSLADSFSCIAQIGLNGCGFEQPLESMRRALDGTNLGNSGFLRNDAMLAVLVVTDEDDCSAQDVTVYNADPSLDNVQSSLGFLSSHRCFEFGVVCNPDSPRVAGPKADCVSRNDSQYMYGMDDYEAFLKGLKALPGRVIFSAIAGVGQGNVVVGMPNGEPNIDPACSSKFGDADEAVRISELSERMGLPPIQSICDDFGPSLDAFASQLSAKMSGRCLVSAPVSGQCSIVDVEDFEGANESIVQELPPCASTPTGACFIETPNSSNCQTGSGIEITIDRRGTQVPSGTVAVAACPQ